MVAKAKEITLDDIRIGDTVRVCSHFQGVSTIQELKVSEKRWDGTLYNAEGNFVTAHHGSKVYLVDRPEPKVGSFWLDPETDAVYVWDDQGRFFRVKQGEAPTGFYGSEGLPEDMGFIPFEGEL